MYEQNSMQFPDVSDVQFHKFGGGNVSHCWNKVRHLGKVIRDYIDCIEAARLQQFAYEIRLNPLPRTIRGWCQLHLTLLLLVPMLPSSADVASLYIPLDPICQIVSPVASQDQLESSQCSQVSC